MASVKEETLFSKVRVYQWNERVHDTDNGDDLMVFVIDNKFSIHNFPSKIPDSNDRTLARFYLYLFGFINPDSSFLNGNDDDSSGRVLNRYVYWKELVKFDRRWLSDNDFGYRMLKALDPGLFLLDDQALVHLGKQISANFNCRFPTNFQTKSRIVIKIEIYRARTIQFEVKDDFLGLFDLVNQQDVVEQPHATLLKSFPRNPFEKIPQAAFDPYFELDSDTVYDDVIHDLVTECDFIDEFVPEEDDIGMFEILGFMRARILSLYPPQDFKEMLGSLKNRMKGLESAAYPYKLMSPEEATGLVEVEPFHPRPRPPSPSTTICPICLDNSNPFAETCCFHTFHAACLSQWISKTPSCPLCRLPL